MKNKKITTILLLLVMSHAIFAQSSVFSVSNLRSEYLTNPLGVDSPNPRLSWLMTDTNLGARQLAFQILVSKDSALITTGTGDVWDSGRLASDAMLTRYAGTELEPFTKYYWSVS